MRSIMLVAMVIATAVLPAIADTIPSAAPAPETITPAAPVIPLTPAVGRPTLDLIPHEKFGEVLDTLERRGIAVNRAMVVAIGVQWADSSVVIISLDSTGAPGRAVSRLSVGDLAMLGAKTDRVIELAVPRAPGAAGKSGKQEGRVYFMIHTTVKAAANYPWALNMAFPDADGREIGGVALLSVGASLYGSYKFTQGMELNYGKVAMMNCFGEAGMGYPRLAVGLASSSRYSRAAEQVGGWAAMVTYPLGIWAGSRVELGNSNNYGNAAVMRDFARWSYLYGFLTPLLFDGRWEDYLPMASGLTMAYMPVGFAAGWLLVKDKEISGGRSVLILVSQSMGTLTGIFIPQWFDENDPNIKASAGCAMLGNLGGAALGFLLWKDRDYSFGQGVFMGASAAVGAGVGLGIPLIFMAEHAASYQVPCIIGMWGGLALGEWLSHSIFERSSRDGKAAANISVPLLAELPAVVAVAAADRRAGRTDRVYSVDVLNVAF